jgi:ribosomal protein S19
MSRSNKKGMFADASLLKKVAAAKNDPKHKPIKT